MCRKIFYLSLFILIILVYSGCNSPTYDIIEVEEPVEIKEELKPPVADIKEETKSEETKSEETKSEEKSYSENQVVSRNYAIQIGAFRRQRNANRCYNSALIKLPGENITLKNIDGVYKIRLGSFNDKDEAIKYLDKIKGAGFYDSFVLELTYVKMDK